MINVFGETKFKPVKKYGRQIPDYFVTVDAKVYSNKTKKFLKVGKSAKDSEYMRVSLNIPIGYFSDVDDFNYYEDNKVSHRVSFDVHRIVLEAWKPIDENPPEQLRDDWDKAPESFKKWVRETAVIDHIDGNPANNHLDNLRWCTPKENNCYRKEHESTKLS